jgi:heme iron utilization protein
MTAELPAENILAARKVVRACRKTAIATLDKQGSPYISLITLALDHDLSPILIISAMSAHTRNIQADPRVSLLFDGTHEYPNPQSGPRVSMQGTALKIEDKAEEERLRARFMARNPGAVGYASFGDFSLWRIAASRAQFVGGFGRALWIDAPFGLDPKVIAAFCADEASARAQLITSGHADVVSIDPDGYDIATGDSWSRIEFDRPAASPKEAIERINSGS